MKTARESGCAAAGSLRMGSLCSAWQHGKICDAFTAAIQQRETEVDRELQLSLARERTALAELSMAGTTIEVLSSKLQGALSGYSKARAERDDYKRAKTENDERLTVERDIARTERDLAHKQLAAAAEALGKLKCLSCRGAGHLPDREAKCQTCKGSGYTAIAAAALVRITSLGSL